MYIGGAAYLGGGASARPQGGYSPEQRHDDHKKDSFFNPEFNVVARGMSRKIGKVLDSFKENNNVVGFLNIRLIECIGEVLRDLTMNSTY